MPDLIGQTLLNRYRVIESLGRGGSAEVYKVWDAHRSSFLAIKVLHADLALDRVFIRRFKREAQTLARLQHPNIVRFYDLEQDGRLVFMLMDYVEGESLKHKIFDANGPMPLTQILEIMRPLCQALHYAHKEGFIHSDVKPGNVLIEKSGRVMLTDFGIACMTETATVTMIGAGTPAYMSPEQARGEVPSGQTDIYSLGVILFEMLTGERPFTGENARTTGSTSEKVRWEQMNLPTPSPRKFNPNISAELEAVVLKCLEKEPQKRYSSALEILNALQNALSVSAKVEAPTSKLDDASTIIKQRPLIPQKRRGIPLYIWMVIGVAIVLFVLIMAGGGVNPALPALTPTLTSAPPTDTPLPTFTHTSIATSLPTFTPTPVLGIGSTLGSPKDGMVMIFVTAGDFEMGSNDGDADDRPVHTVYLDGFWMDQTEVTNSMYAKCVAESVCPPPLDTGSNTRDSYYGNSEFGDYPVIFVNWNMAKTYCEWAGRRLPTEAEWEKTARGPQAFTYPWGNESPNSGLLNYSGNIGDTMKVGSYPDGASIYGALDMAGNVWEWVSSLYLSYPYDAKDGRENMSSLGDRVLRGGSWNFSGSVARSSLRVRSAPDLTYINIGFRCARSLP